MADDVCTCDAGLWATWHDGTCALTKSRPAVARQDQGTGDGERRECMIHPGYPLIDGKCYHPSSRHPAPAAVPDGVERAKLREDIARYVYGLSNPDRFWDAEWLDRTSFFESADGLLDGPLAPLLAQAADDRAKVTRAERAIEAWRTVAQPATDRSKLGVLLNILRPGGER